MITLSNKMYDIKKYVVILILSLLFLCLSLYYAFVYNDFLVLCGVLWLIIMCLCFSVRHIYEICRYGKEDNGEAEV